MGRYYFNLRNHVDVDDEEGKDFPTVDDARRYGCELAREMVATTAKEEGELDLAHYIEVVDETGALITRILFGEVVQVRIAGRAVV